MRIVPGIFAVSFSNPRLRFFLSVNVLVFIVGISNSAKGLQYVCSVLQQCGGQRVSSVFQQCSGQRVSSVFQQCSGQCVSSVFQQCGGQRVS